MKQIDKIYCDVRSKANYNIPWPHHCKLCKKNPVTHENKTCRETVFSQLMLEMKYNRYLND